MCFQNNSMHFAFLADNTGNRTLVVSRQGMETNIVWNQECFSESECCRYVPLLQSLSPMSWSFPVCANLSPVAFQQTCPNRPLSVNWALCVGPAELSLVNPAPSAMNQAQYLPKWALSHYNASNTTGPCGAVDNLTESLGLRTVPTNTNTSEQEVCQELAVPLHEF
jgi:hypothetical protein